MCICLFISCWKDAVKIFYRSIHQSMIYSKNTPVSANPDLTCLLLLIQSYYHLRFSVSFCSSYSVLILTLLQIIPISDLFSYDFMVYFFECMLFRIIDHHLSLCKFLRTSFFDRSFLFSPAGNAWHAGCTFGLHK